MGRTKVQGAGLFMAGLGLHKARFLLAPAALYLGRPGWALCMGSGPSNGDGRH